MSTSEIPNTTEGTPGEVNESMGSLPTDDSDPVEGDDAEQGTEQDESGVLYETDPLNNVRRLLPVHAAPKRGAGGGALKVTRSRGRPRKVEKMPTTSDLEYHSQMAEAKEEFITHDPVVVATTGKADVAGVLRTLRAEIAKEAAALHFQRIENEKFGKDTSQTSTRRVDALTKVANIELEIAKLGPSNIDVRSEKFQRVVKLFLEFIRDAASETLQPETLNLFFNRLETKMTNWEDKAEEVLR